MFKYRNYLGFPYFFMTQSNNFKDITGRAYAYLTVIKILQKKGTQNQWLCKCKCGNETICTTAQLNSGGKKSCGCLKIMLSKLLFTTHGMSKSPEYIAWIEIRKRCYDVKNSSFHRYGGRGIKMFDGWINDFQSFYNYVGNRPSSNHSIDRFPNNETGHYEPGNIKWSTKKEQASNRRSNVFLTYNGITNTLTEWSRILNVRHQYISRNIKKNRTLSDIIEHLDKRKNLNTHRLTWK